MGLTGDRYEVGLDPASKLLAAGLISQIVYVIKQNGVMVRRNDRSNIEAVSEQCAQVDIWLIFMEKLLNKSCLAGRCVNIKVERNFTWLTNHIKVMHILSMYA